MSTVSITPSSYIMYQGTFRGSKSGTLFRGGVGTNYTSAYNNAVAAAQNAVAGETASASHGPTDITSSNVLQVGSTIGTTSRSSTITNVTVIQTSGNEYSATAYCNYEISLSSANMYQLKLKFSFPSGITAANITSATMAFDYTGSGSSSDTTFAVAAPNSTTELTTFWDTNDTSSSTYNLLTDKVAFDVGNLTGSVSLNILEAIQACYQYNQPYLLLHIQRPYPNRKKVLTLNAVPTIVLSTDVVVYSYTLAFNDTTGEAIGLPAPLSQAGTANSYTFTVPNIQPRRNGYKFIGWTTTAGSHTITHQAGNNVVVNKNTIVTLYPVWSLIYGIGIVNGDYIIPVIPLVKT